MIHHPYLIMFSLNLGLSKELPAMNCKDLKLKVPSSTSGVYWIDPDAGSLGNAFQAYCDQETDGGGWTLVWSYTLLKFYERSECCNSASHLEGKQC